MLKTANRQQFDLLASVDAQPDIKLVKENQAKFIVLEVSHFFALIHDVKVTNMVLQMLEREPRSAYVPSESF